MAGLFSITVAGDEVRAGLAAILQRSRDLTPFWRDVFAPRYFGQIQDLFAMEGQGRTGGGQFASGGWAPLTPAYAAWKKRRFPGMPILQRTQRLRQSLEWTGGALGPEGVFQPMPRTVLVGTDVPYAKHVNRTRPFLPTPDAEEYARLLRNWILSGEGDTE